uniref:Uncharacterized protein n=1 Tax=Anguilla anguilla TaxID=7936 RepID=A0A0E9PYU6_ANGAN
MFCTFSIFIFMDFLLRKKGLDCR